MADDATIDPRQRREFARTGFLTLVDALDPALVERARADVTDAMPGDPDDPATLRGHDYEVQFDVESEAVAALDEAVFPIVEALVGEGALAPPDGNVQVALNYPEPLAEVPPAPALAGHLDGYPNFDENPEPHLHAVGATVYLGRVEPRGGGFTVWPGSHRIAARYFESHALETPGGKPDNARLPAPDEGGDGWDYDTHLDRRYAPHEVTGGTGTVVLWHGLLTHTAGQNRSPNARIAAISRFLPPESDGIDREAARNPFRHWPAMRGVDLE
jgi:hypothetical protein